MSDSQEHMNGDGNQTDFSLEVLKSCFEQALADDGVTINVDKYILGKSLKKNLSFSFSIQLYCHFAGYDELYKFLNLLGTVFGWVATDVYNKMEVVREHRRGEHKDKYESVQGMLEYEVEANLIKHKAKDSSTGTRNLLRLHRALEYITAFLGKNRN